MVSTLLDVVYIESKMQVKNPESYATKSNKVSANPKWLSFVGAALQSDVSRKSQWSIDFLQT